MSKYKLVPIEPTQEMIDEGRTASTHPRERYKAMLAAPQPSFQLPDFATSPDDSDEGASLWDHGFKTGWNSCLEDVAKTLQSTTQQPTPEVVVLVEALEKIAAFQPKDILCGSGWKEWNRAGEYASSIALAALTAYCKLEE